MSYPTDLTRRQIMLVESMIGPEMPKLRKYDFVSVLNAIFYVIKTGCQWRMMPADMPPWQTAYHHFRSWSDRGWFGRNYEMHLHVARHVFVAACVLFMLRYFA